MIGHAPTRRGTILSSQQIFILSREGLRRRGQRMNNFLPAKLPMPAIGLS